MRANPLRLGLTGGIGSGKSTVAALLAAHGATLIDTDAIARTIAAPGGMAIAAINARFGPAVIDAAGGLDRARMRELVFNDPTAKQALEAILHPMIGQECETQAAAASTPLIVFDVPLLVESKRWRSIVDQVMVVDAREETQIKRVVERSGWSTDMVRSVIRHQATRSERLAAADVVICNDQLTLAELTEEVHHFYLRLGT